MFYVNTSSCVMWETMKPTRSGGYIQAFESEAEALKALRKAEEAMTAKVEWLSWSTVGRKCNGANDTDTSDIDAKWVSSHFVEYIA